MDLFYTDKIDLSIAKDLDYLLATKLEDHPQTGNSKQFEFRFTSKNKSETTRTLIEIVTPFFEKANITFNPNNGRIQYESYRYNSPKHIDNFDVSSADQEYEDRVVVCYIITRKTENIKGGNITIYKDYYSFLNMIGYEKSEEIEVPMEVGSIFITRDDVAYKNQGCSGCGYLNQIRLIFYKNKRFGYSYDNDDDEE